MYVIHRHAYSHILIRSVGTIIRTRCSCARRLLLYCAFSFNTRALYCVRARLIQCLLEEDGEGGVSAAMHSRHNTIIIRCRVRHREDVYESSLSFFSFLFREIIECAT